MAAEDILCCGPSAAAARLEGSKAFTKELAEAAGIPTARWEQFTDAAEARDFASRRSPPVVVKADGLAAGKGVVVAQTEAEADAAIDRFIAAGPVIIEECLVGEEVSLFALCDGLDAIFLGTARDHKRVGDGDTGPNTGGMGAISPAPGFDPAPAMDRIIRPALAEMVRRGTPFRGVLFAGLMVTESGADLIEFNVRFGDPECQALMARLQSDLLPALVAACQGELANFDLRFRAEASCAVVMAARGYPDAARDGNRDRRARSRRRGAGRAGVPRRHGPARRGSGGRRRPGADAVRHRPRCGECAGGGVCGGGPCGMGRWLLPARYRGLTACPRTCRAQKRSALRQPCTRAQPRRDRTRHTRPFIDHALGLAP